MMIFVFCNVVSVQFLNLVWKVVDVVFESQLYDRVGVG